MNLKRALLTAAALAALPVAAIAQTTSSSFEVNVSFDPDLDKTTTVYISCNGGVPLEQQKTGLGDGDTVTFIVAETGATTDCEIWADDVAGFTVNGGNDDPACIYTDVGEDADFTGVEDACYIDFTADDVRFTVTKTWDITNAGGDLLNPSYSITVTCDEEIVDDSGYASCTKDNLSCEFDGSGTSNASFWVDVALTGTDGSVYCNAVESVVDSAVESDRGCASGVNIGVGASGACTITNTVFYEGIPTLSQYGLALMALLMLGVGFIGFRRLV